MTVSELNNAVIAVRDGDISAFEKLYDEYYEPLRFYIAKRIGSVEQAKDLAQDTFVTAMEKIKDLKSPEAFKVWLYTIANNITNSYFKEINRFSSYESNEELDSVLEQAEEYSEPMYVPHDYLENKETQMEVRKAIDALSPERRSVLIMFYFENMKMKEIAAAMNINENAVGHRLTEARRQICKKLKAMGSRNFVLVPLPLVMQVIEEEAKRSGGSAFSGHTASTAAVSGSAVRRVVASSIAALAIGGGIYAHLLFRNDSFGDVRLPDSSASQSITETSVMQNTVITQTSPSDMSLSTSQPGQTEPVLVPGGDTDTRQTQGAAGSSRDRTGTTAVSADATDRSASQTAGSAPENGTSRYANDTQRTGGQSGTGTGGGTNRTTSDAAHTGGQGTQPAVQTSREQETSDQQPGNYVIPSSMIAVQQESVKRAFPKSDSEYSTLLGSADSSDDVTQEAAEQMMKDIFSFADAGYLPAGGYVFYNDGGNTNSSDDIYMYVLPTKKITIAKTGCTAYITGWVSYRHNYSSPNGFDSFSKSTNPFPSYDGKVDSTCKVFSERESRSGGVLVERCMEVIVTRSGAPKYGGFSFGLTRDAQTKRDLDNVVLLNSSVSKSAELSMVDYIRSNSTRFTRINTSRTADEKRSSLPIY